MIENLSDVLSLTSVLIIILLLITYAIRFGSKRKTKFRALERIEEEYQREFDDIEDEEIDY